MAPASTRRRTSGSRPEDISVTPRRTARRHSVEEEKEKPTPIVLLPSPTRATPRLTVANAAAVIASVQQERLAQTTPSPAASQTSENSVTVFRGPKQFRARRSHLDREALHGERKHEFRGFFTLFWLILVSYVAVTIAHNMRTFGTPVQMNFAKVILRDILLLAVVDAVMVLSTGMAFILQWLIVKGWLSYHWSFPLGHLLQSSLIASSVFVGIHRDWPWVQSGVLVLHSIVLFMKIHSYLRTNAELAEEQEKEKRTTVGYPENVTLANFIDFMLVPTLVYELEYPRTEKVRIHYLIEKAMASLGTFVLLYLIVSDYILPVLHNMRKLTVYETIVQLLLPFIVGYMLVFYIIFECVCNFFAELTRFADREFYEDWWNSTTFDEYARKWNKPVHDFLLRHVYVMSMKSYKLSKHSASFVTFLFSACLHEMVLAVTGRRIRLYLFGLQMLQLPLIYLGRLPYFRKHPVTANVFFWFSMVLGPPLLGVLYSREHYLT